MPGSRAYPNSSSPIPLHFTPFGTTDPQNTPHEKVVSRHCRPTSFTKTPSSPPHHVRILHLRHGDAFPVLLSAKEEYLAILLLLVARDLRVLYLFAALYDFILQAAGPIILLMIVELFGLRSYATILACSRLAGSIGGATRPILVGCIFDVTGSYYTGFLICVGMSIMSLLAIIILWPSTNLRKLVEILFYFRLV